MLLFGNHRWPQWMDSGSRILKNIFLVHLLDLSVQHRSILWKKLLPVIMKIIIIRILFQNKSFILYMLSSLNFKRFYQSIALRNLKSEVDSLDLEQFEHTKTFVEKFFDAKLNLLDIKRDLVSLTSKIRGN